MTLKETLEAKAQDSSIKIPKEKQSIMASAINELEDANLVDNVLKTGDSIPYFKLPNAYGKLIDSKAMLTKENLVITFYRGGWCPYCNLELRALQEHLPEFNKLDTSLVAISPEKPDHSLSTAEKNDLSFEVLSDYDNQVASAFHLVYDLPLNLIEVYKEFDIDLVKSNDTGRWQLPISATYIVNKQGIIIYDFIKEDYKKRADPLDMIKFLKNR